MNNMLAIAPILLLAGGVSACAGSARTGSPPATRQVDVMCNSTVGYDTASCQVRANASCGKEARLTGIISSVEMTGRPTGQLYTTTARYDCGAS